MSGIIRQAGQWLPGSRAAECIACAVAGEFVNGEPSSASFLMQVNTPTNSASEREYVQNAGFCINAPTPVLNLQSKELASPG